MSEGQPGASTLGAAGVTARHSGDPVGALAPDPRRWKALAVCLVAGFMTLLDVSIVNVAIPSIERGLQASTSGLQWVLSGYALAYGLALVPGGRLGDAVSRRSMFMAGVVLFTVASAAAGAAHSELFLVVSRLVQGAAGGLMMPQVSGFIQQLFSGAERGRAFGTLGMVIGISTAVGPLLGGLLIQVFGAEEGWRWVFYVNLPIGIAVLPLALRLLPGRPPPPHGQGGRPTLRVGDLDPLGVVLLAGATVLVLLPFLQEQQWPGAQKWLLVPVGLLVLGVFLLWERRHARRYEPLVRLELFAERPYTLGVLLSLIYFAGFTAIFFIFTLYLQAGLGYSALLAGLASTPFALGSVVGSGSGGRLVERHGRTLVAIGLLLVVVGLLGTALAVHLVPGEGVAWAALVPLLVAGVGSGYVVAPNQTLTLSRVPVVRASSAGGVLQTAQRIGSAAGIAAVGSVFFSSVESTRGDWAGTVQLALVVAVGFLVAALLVAAADILADRFARPPGRHRAARRGTPGRPQSGSHSVG